jgi:ribosomal protein L11 methyltransferase
MRLVADQRWLEISLEVDGELAEAVADVITRYAEGGAVVENGITCLSVDDPGTPLPIVRVFGYLPLDDTLEERRQRLEQGLFYLSRIQPLPQPEYRTIEDQDWMTAWKVHYRPIPVGRRLMVLPAWIEPQDPERIPIHIDPSMAFGTGTHPTTHLCLEMIEKYVRPGEPVMDVGCGSGILSIAALKLGASHALGVDIDIESVKATRNNSEFNRVFGGMEIGQGSVAEVLEGNFSITESPVVLVNILAVIILRLFEAGLAKLVAEGGTLILSGILDEQEDRIRAAAQADGLTLIDRAQMKDWVSLVYQK